MRLPSVLQPLLVFKADSGQYSYKNRKMFSVGYYAVQRLWATGWTIGVLGFDSRRGLGVLLFTTASRTALGPTQPPIQWVPGVLSLGVKRQGSEADHSHPSNAEVKNEWSYTSTPPIRLHGVVLSYIYTYSTKACFEILHTSVASENRVLQSY
jgi:hypothetical protein